LDGNALNYQAALDTAIAAAKEAGEILRTEFHRPEGPRGTAHHAEADEVAEEVIRRRLLAAEPWSYLGEETGVSSDLKGIHFQRNKREPLD
jgi:ADP-ribosyl-[dinitrogen reductase] hydrolase